MPDDRLLPDLFHLADPAEWAAAQQAGRYDRSTRGASLAEVGFVHLSFAWQVEATAGRYYADLVEPPLLLRVDPRLLDVPVRVDPAPSGEGFAHAYGPLPVTAVVDVRPMERVDGAWRAPACWRVGAGLDRTG